MESQPNLNAGLWGCRIEKDKKGLEACKVRDRLSTRQATATYGYGRY